MTEQKPLTEKDLLAREGQGLRLIPCNGRSAAKAGDVQVYTASSNIGDGWIRNTGANSLTTILSGVIGRIAVDVGVVQNAQSGEILPRQTSGVLRTVRDILSKHGPVGVKG